MAVREKAIKKALRISLEGKVQGVGFRPFVYRLANRFGLDGAINNTGEGVTIEVEGSPLLLQDFLGALTGELPPLAAITVLNVHQVPVKGRSGFQIETTKKVGPAKIQLPPDAAVCPECIAEIKGPKERRHRYPFTNCTNCGPRFTITKSLPYDRERTTMEPFSLCPHCLAEYLDPLDRRFHAQPMACPACGPKIQVLSRNGKSMEEDWQKTAHDALKAGDILAIKGLGGFHLACDAKNPGAVGRLRQGKKRGAKPFAVMAKNLNAARKYCIIDPGAAHLLTSGSSPIVACPRKVSPPLPEDLAPGLSSLGVMLPYTPLHYLLFNDNLDLLAMTSGNMGGLPLVTGNEAALEELAGLADLFLLHNREITGRCDDSLIVPPLSWGRYQVPALLLRRSRGYVPEPLEVPGPGLPEAVAGWGGEAKNTFCILQGHKAYLSQHLGEMACTEGQDAFGEAYKHWCSLLDCRPAVLGYDPHPGYAVSRMALRKTWEARYAVQHHHAHMAAVMGEHGLRDKVLAAVLDGSGFGPDGNIWGFEVLSGDFAGFQRLYHMRYLPLPGGERAVREPWRTAFSLLFQGEGEGEALRLGSRLFKKNNRELAAVLQLIKASFNAPLASSGGRLFDAAAALMGLCRENTYEGEGALKLNQLVPAPAGKLGGAEKLENPGRPGSSGRRTDRTLAHGSSQPAELKALTNPPYPYEICGSTIDFSPLAREMAREALAGEKKETMAWKFHLTLSLAVRDLLVLARQRSGLDKVVLGGGVFQNRVLLLLCQYSLEEAGFQVYFSSRVPPNDGGLSLGQALVAAWRRWHDVPGGTRKNP